jgi:hypothetical protein
MLQYRFQIFLASKSAYVLLLHQWQNKCLKTHSNVLLVIKRITQQNQDQRSVATVGRGSFFAMLIPRILP